MSQFISTVWYVSLVNIMCMAVQVKKLTKVATFCLYVESNLHKTTTLMTTQKRLS